MESGRAGDGKRGSAGRARQLASAAGSGRRSRGLCRRLPPPRRPPHPHGGWTRIFPGRLRGGLGYGRGGSLPPGRAKRRERASRALASHHRSRACVRGCVWGGGAECAARPTPAPCAPCALCARQGAIPCYQATLHARTHTADSRPHSPPLSLLSAVLFPPPPPPSFLPLPKTKNHGSQHRQDRARRRRPGRRRLRPARPWPGPPVPPAARGPDGPPGPAPQRAPRARPCG